MEDMPTARRYLTASVIDGKIYAIGGLGGLNRTEVYDPEMDTWTRKADMPTPRVFASAGVVDGKIYVLGGASRLHGTPYTTVEQYDPESDTWTEMEDMPSRAYFMNSCTVDGKIYLIGGYSSGGRPGDAPLSSCYAFDPLQNTWTVLPDMPSGRALGYARSIDGAVYVAGGLNAAWPSSNGVWKFDPARNKWATRASMPAPRAGAGAAVLGNKIYTFGGIGGHGYISETSFYTYEPSSDTWETLEKNAIQKKRNGCGHGRWEFLCHWRYRRFLSLRAVAQYRMEIHARRREQRSGRRRH